jgi:hypothetical protein
MYALFSRRREPLPLEIQLGTNALKFTGEHCLVFETLVFSVDAA